VDPLPLLQRILSNPAASDLVIMQNALLSWEERADTVQKRDQAAAALHLLGDFHHYLIGLEAKLEAHDYAKIASRMDMGAVGGVVAENMLGAGPKLLERVLVGGFSEILMVLASRQYVKAFDRELEAFYKQVAWQLREHIWHFSAARRPGLAPSQRESLMEALFSPMLDPETSGEAKSIALGCLFQVLLLDAVVPIFFPV
jgi:hypothetical protein